jgi:hypothetical protein
MILVGGGTSEVPPPTSNKNWLGIFMNSFGSEVSWFLFYNAVVLLDLIFVIGYKLEIGCALYKL